MTTFLIDSTLDWLVKSSVFLLVLLGVYRIWLESQPMHQLKRAYLLSTLLLALAGPLVSIQMPTGWLSSRSVAQLAENHINNSGNTSYGSDINRLLTVADRIAPAANVPEPNVPTPYWLYLYGAVTVLMLARFAKNLFVLLRQTRTNPTEPYYGATLVKLPGNGLPYTFLHYLFVSGAVYDRGEIEAELFDHELAHVRQRHSLDVLLVEIALCFYWFNPLLFWLKWAMQRNHEFLADEAVNQTYLNVPGYQHLLLSKVAFASPKLSLTSTLTFQTTKQRLLMMTKQTSFARTWLAVCSTTLLFVALTVVLTGAAPAQPPIFPLKSETTPPTPRPQLSVAEIESRFGEVVVYSACEERLEKGTRFKDLKPGQKARVAYFESRLPALFNEEEFEALKNTRQYSIWVDGKRVRRLDQTALMASDIITYNIRRIYKHARRPDVYHYQVDLLTDSKAVAFAREQLGKPRLLLLTPEKMERYREQAVK